MAGTQIRCELITKSDAAFQEANVMTSEQRPDRNSLSPEKEIGAIEVPEGVDRRTFLMRSALIGATTVITGRAMGAEEQTARATAPAPALGAKMSPDLNVVKKS